MPVTHNKQAKEVVIIITGAHKALALQKCIEGPVNHMWTLSSLQMHKHSMIVVDDDATLELQVKTVKYFKSIEGVANECGVEQVLPMQVLNAPVIAYSPKGSGSPQTNGLKPPGDQVKRPVTPDIVLDNMSSRIRDTVPEGMQSSELAMSNMRSRMPVMAI
jgi:glucosamine-6-phosphate deaminase